MCANERATGWLLFAGYHVLVECAGQASQFFLPADQQPGGYILESRPHQAKVSVQLLSQMEMGLPMSEAFLQLDFQRDISQDLEKAEM